MPTEVLKRCTVEGNIVKLPAEQLDRDLYLKVKKSLELIGGKWKGGKVQGFVFPTDPTSLLQQVAGGTKRNLQKEYQFFGTPDWLADEMVREAGIEEYDMLLEPSAGQGAIIKAIHRAHPGHLVHYCELMDVNRTFLEKLPDVAYITDNFLKLSRNKLTVGTFDRIIANPPFSKNQDIDHIRQMYECLKPGGRIVTISSAHWDYASGKKEKTFRDWLYDINAVYEKIPAGVFKESGTEVATFKIIIDK